MKIDALLARRPLAIALMAAMATAFTPLALAQNASEDEAEEEASELDKIVVTGSRIKRAEVEGPAPVTVVTREQIDKEGYTTVFDALNSLTQFEGSVQNELTQNGFTPNASVLNLRGLGPGRLLTLINGRRVAEYPRPYNSQSNFVNLGTIPLAAVERIEVLSGGASAIYGSDAVAGVVNVILRENYEGNQVSVQVGKPTEGGSETYDGQFIGGATSDTWSLTYALQYYKRGAIYASQRDFMDSYRDDPSTDNPTAVEGLRIRNRSVAAIEGFSVRYLPPGRTVDGVCSQFEGFESYDAGLASGTTRPVGPSCAWFGYPAEQAIRNSDENISGYFHSTFDLDNGIQLFATLQALDAESQTASNTEFISVSGLIGDRAPRNDVFFDPNVNAFLDFQRIFTPSEIGGAGSQGTTYNENTYDIAVGANGDFGESFDWDFGLSSSKYESETTRPRLLRDPAIAFFLGPQLGLASNRGVYALNMDRFLRPLTPEEYASISTIVKTSAESKSDQGTFVVTGDIFEMDAGSVSFAGTLEYASQSYDLNPDPRTLPGNTEIVNLVDTGGGGDRDRGAVGAEFSIPLHSTITANVAGRYDRYDDITDVDGAFTYNLGLEWRPLDAVLLRGSYATSFRAPDMHFIYAGESGFFTTYFDEYNCRLDGNEATSEACGSGSEYRYSAAGTRRGNAALEEEEGESFTAGVVWDITDDLSMTVDYYDIELEGVVDDDVTSLLNTEANCRLGRDRNGNAVDPTSAECVDALARVTRAANIAGDLNIVSVSTNPKNTAFLGTSGIDATMSYTIDTDSLGDFRFEAGWTHVLEKEQQEFEQDPVEDIRDDLQYFDFRSRGRASVLWNKGDFGAGVSMTRFGSLPNWAETGRIAPFFLWNLTAGYEINENLSVGVVVNNVLNNFHPEDDTFNSYPFFWRAFSPIGREVFGNISYKF